MSWSGRCWNCEKAVRRERRWWRRTKPRHRRHKCSGGITGPTMWSACQCECQYIPSNVVKHILETMAHDASFDG